MTNITLNIPYHITDFVPWFHIYDLRSWLENKSAFVSRGNMGNKHHSKYNTTLFAYKFEAGYNKKTLNSLFFANGSLGR